ncbi:MAG: DUF4340 domain-containing protein [Gammaproteobacteria bacterium]|nr:DUF4340 domain-containing protein [Gammaproteobacteria bacterium]
MNGRINLLSGLLAVQLVIIAGVFLLDSGYGEARQGPLLDFTADAVDEISISDGADGQTLTLSRDEDGWRLPDGLPADAARISDVLSKLAGLQAPWPVATSAAAIERFEVADDQHQRRLVLRADDTTVADLYLGTSPGYQQVHARRAGDSAVYPVDLANYQVPAGAGEWLDKTLLQPRGEISAVVRAGAWTLHSGETGWLVDEVAADQDAAAELVRRLQQLRVTGIAEAPGEAAEPVASLRITDADGTFELRLFGGGDQAPYQVRSERRDGYFELAAHVAERILLDAAALLGQAEDGSGEPED